MQPQFKKASNTMLEQVTVTLVSAHQRTSFDQDFLRAAEALGALNHVIALVGSQAHCAIEQITYDSIQVSADLASYIQDAGVPQLKSMAKNDEINAAHFMGAAHGLLKSLLTTDVNKKYVLRDVTPTQILDICLAAREQVVISLRLEKSLRLLEKAISQGSAPITSRTFKK